MLDALLEHLAFPLSDTPHVAESNLLADETGL